MAVPVRACYRLPSDQGETNIAPPSTVCEPKTFTHLFNPPTVPFSGSVCEMEIVLLGNPTVCVQGDRVTHLVFPVVR